MNVAERMHGLPRIGLDIMGDLADEHDMAAEDRVIRLENADSDIPPPEIAVRATREAVGKDEYNSWLPLVGLRDLRAAVAERLHPRGRAGLRLAERSDHHQRGAGGHAINAARASEPGAMG